VNDRKPGAPPIPMMGLSLLLAIVGIVMVGLWQFADVPAAIGYVGLMLGLIGAASAIFQAMLRARAESEVDDDFDR
jgi:hypothetical protein